jgi:hypothetical protein
VEEEEEEEEKVEHGSARRIKEGGWGGSCHMLDGVGWVGVSYTHDISVCAPAC